MPFFQKLRSLGPGLLIASAFIGPGTVTVCTLAGYQFGYQLLWALLFSVIATIILQEMCVRLGIITQNGLGNALQSLVKTKTIKILIILLVFSAVIIGNGAYEAGNIAGASLGLSTIFGEKYSDIISLSVGLMAFLIILSKSYKVVERMMIGLVVLMSIVFLVTAIYLKPDTTEILKGTFIPAFPEGSTLLIAGLIGTTVVPYNLFLHTSASSAKWKDAKDLPNARFDTIFSIFAGGLISMAVIITAASASVTGSVDGAADLAIQLEPLLGAWAKYFVASGLFAAGISSSVTAPLAAAYAASGIFGFPGNIQHWKFRLVSGSILIIGVFFAMTGFKPVDIIKFAQVANGILLPVMAIFLFWVMNKKTLLNQYVNNTFQNLLGLLVIMITLFLGVKSILAVAGLL